MSETKDPDHLEEEIIESEEQINELDEEYEEYDEEEGDEYEEEEGEDEEEEEEEEPQLKYQRLVGSLPTIFAKENGNYSSALAVSDKFLALGTHIGHLYLLDFQGNMNTEKTFKSHNGSINDVSVDKSGDFIATCSNDGKVIIHALYSDELVEYSFDRPCLSVSLDPDYAKKKDRPVCAGGKSGELVIFKKGGWFSSKQKVVIGQGEGTIHAVRWRGNFIAYANDKCISLYDVSANQRVFKDPRSKNAPRPDMFRCCLEWVPSEGRDTSEKLIVGWGNSITVYKFTPQLQKLRVEIVAVFTTHYSYICGIAPYNENLLLLTYDYEPVDNPQQNITAPKPELKVVDYNGKEISCDSLLIKDYENYFVTDYRLEYYLPDNVFYIFSQRDIVVARPRDIDDHIAFLIQNNKYPEALECVKENVNIVKNYTPLQVGEMYLKYLMEKKQFETTAKLLPSIIGNDKSLWEKWIYIFIDKRKFQDIVDLIPLDNPRLSAEIYEMKLTFLLMHDPEEFLHAIETWDHSLYELKNITAAVSERIKENSNSVPLLNALAQLYLYDKQYDKALIIYLKLKRPDVFEFIEKYELFSEVKDKITSLLEFDESRALDLFINNLEKIPVDQVVSQLQNRRLLLHKYLHNLFRKSVRAGEKYHLLQVELYAEYETEQLVPFLEESQSYNIDKAREICEKFLEFHEDENKKNMLIRGIVYLEGRMGNTNHALRLIIDKLQDVDFAIEFVEKQKDFELWQDLINYSLKNPKFISGLLDHIGDHMDPMLLITKIPKGIEIPGLKMKLAKIISDYTLQMTLQKGTLNIIKADTKVASGILYKKQRMGVSVGPFTKCQICSKHILGSREDAVTFTDGKTFHVSCYKKTFLDEKEDKSDAKTQKPFSRWDPTTHFNGKRIVNITKGKKNTKIES